MKASVRTMKASVRTMKASVDGICSGDFVERVHLNQLRLPSEMKPQYDFMICGSGSSRSVVARRLAENPEVSVLLVEGAGEGDVPRLNEPGQWFLNVRSERDWNYADLRHRDRRPVCAAHQLLDDVRGAGQRAEAGCICQDRIWTTIDNTMAACVVIGERAAEILNVDHRS